MKQLLDIDFFYIIETENKLEIISLKGIDDN